MTDEEAALVKELCGKMQKAIEWDKYSPQIVLAVLAIAIGTTIKANVKPECVNEATKLQIKVIRDVIKTKI